MYLLVHLLCSHGFALYRINDPLEYNSPLLNDLRPLLVFPSTDGQPDYFNCIKLESRFYFFGLNHCFGAEGTDKERLLRIVYTIDEEQLLRIEPSEHNDINKFKELLIPTENPMHGSKYVPTLFVANRKLYVLSRDFEDSMFEVFDPCGQTWHMLQPCPFVKPRSYDAPLCVLEKERIVCFADVDEIVTLDLDTDTWITPPGGYENLDYDNDCDFVRNRPPLFMQNRVSIIGDLAFGFRIDAKTYKYHVCASSSSGKEVMHANLAPDQAFLDELRFSRFTYLRQHYELYSEYIVSLQDSEGKQVMCVVTYGPKPSDQIRYCPFDSKTSYVALSFFDIPGDFYTSKGRPQGEYDSRDSYADEKAEDGDGVSIRYFNAKFRHASHFVISNTQLPTHGQLVACFF